MNEFGTVQLFHPRGPRAHLPLPNDPKESFAHVDRYLEAGWLIREPGLEEGEQKEEVGFVLKAEHGEGEQATPILLLYSSNDQLAYSFLKVYLNKEEDVAAFEAASGMKLNEFPYYPGSDKPELGKSAKTDQFIVKVKRPFSVICKPHPKYVESERTAAVAKGEIYKIPKRLFIRWDGVDSAPAKESPPANNQGDNGTPRREGAQTPAKHAQHSTANAWTLEQAISECSKHRISKDELRAAIKKSRPDSTGWNMLADTAIAQRLIQQRT